MKIINIADIHGNLTPIDGLGAALCPVDLVIISGDLTHFGDAGDAEDVISAVAKYNRNILAVTGNCDTRGVDEYLNAKGFNLHGRSVKINGISFSGAGGSLPCPSPTPNVYTEEEYAGIFEASLGDSGDAPSRILVSHQPPYNTLNDMLTSGAHVGSRTVRQFIERCKPLVCFTGHIHEAPGIDTIGETRVVNPGPLGTRSYAYLDVTDKINVLEIRKF